MWELRRYDDGMKEVWDGFIRTSRNGTFLFLRDYMDYHRDRFADSSLMAYKNGKLRALLPADISISDGFRLADEEPEIEFRSHAGLTYGGWVIPISHFNANDMLDLFDVWLGWCRENCIDVIDYKPVPWIYPLIPAQEDLYALYRNGFTLTRLYLSSTVDMRRRRPFNTLQKRHLKEARRTGATVGEICDIGEFHRMLTDCLSERHDTTPVHSLAELELLHSRFPDKIRFHGVWLDGVLAAGVCVFDTGTVAHAQYIASTPEGRRHNLLTLLFSHLLDEVYSGSGVSSHRFFDFGTSNEDGSRTLNSGLLEQKASLGGSAVAYPAWTLRLH